jgi:hypothetical protein
MEENKKNPVDPVNPACPVKCLPGEMAKPI